MKPLTITLPEPPSVNRVWRKGKGGKLYLNPKAATFYTRVQAALRTAGVWRIRFPAPTPVRYTLTWYRARKAGDLSNRLKCFEDALNGLVWTDDQQVVGFTCQRIDGQRPARVEVTIERAA